MGAGDWWHLRSDGAGSWWPIARHDSAPLGRPVLETTMAFSPGGWVAHNGFLYNRAEWPWAWDHAQASGMLTTEALRAGKEGMWTSGDGATTFRTPEARGEFMRVLDESRGIDSARAAGSFQRGTLVVYDLSSVSGIQAARSPDPISDNISYFGADVITAATYPNTVEVGIAGPSAALGTNSCIGSARSRNIAYPGRLKLI